MNKTYQIRRCYPSTRFVGHICKSLEKAAGFRQPPNRCVLLSMKLSLKDVIAPTTVSFAKLHRDRAIVCNTRHLNLRPTPSSHRKACSHCLSCSLPLTPKKNG